MIRGLQTTTALGALALALLATPALAGTTTLAALNASGLIGIDDLTGEPSGGSSYEPVISGDGKVIGVNLSTNSGSNGYTIDATNGWKLLPKPGAATDWYVRGISTDGAVVVGSGNSATKYFAASWKAGAATVLADLGSGSNGSFAWGVSGDGHVVVGASANSANASQPVKWVDGAAPVKLTGTGFTAGSANAASSDGSVIVGAGVTAAHSSEAFRWTSSGGMVSLGLVSDASNALASSQASAVSNDGSVVAGTSFNASAQGQAFRWTQSGGIKTVSDFLTAKGLTVATGSKFYVAHSISNDGSVIVGEGHINGTDQAFIARTAASTSGGGGTGVVGVTTFLGTVGENGAFQSGVASAMQRWRSTARTIARLATTTCLADRAAG